MKRCMALALVGVLVGCAESPVDEPQLGEQSLALSKEERHSPPSSWTGLR